MASMQARCTVSCLHDVGRFIGSVCCIKFFFSLTCQNPFGLPYPEYDY
jgi:hypothetical protein